MIRVIKSLFIANWRNKAVALFFAVSIWFVAYQSETREYTTALTVRFRPADAENTVIMGALVENEQGAPVNFDDRVNVVFSGPRKQIDRLREGLQEEETLVVPADVDRHEFTSEDFGFPRDGVSISSIEPALVRIEKQALVTERFDLASLVTVSPLPRGHEVIKSVDPEYVTLRGPRSVVGVVSVTVPVAYEGQPVDSSIQLRVEAINRKDEELVSRLVQVLDFHDGTWVAPSSSPYVQVNVQLKPTEESFEPDAVRVMFGFPVTDESALQFTLDDVPGDRIPVAFSGPKEQIEKLRKAVLEAGFALVVPPPPGFDPKAGRTYTFSESDLKLYGFPGVVIDQHESRKKELKSSFSYRVRAVPVKQGEEG